MTRIFWYSDLRLQIYENRLKIFFQFDIELRPKLCKYSVKKLKKKFAFLEIRNKISNRRHKWL